MTAQVVTITPTALPKAWTEEGILKVSWDWMTDSVNGAIVGSVTPYEIKGVLAWFEAIPDPASTTPTAAYTFTVKDESGVDILHGLGVGSATATAIVSKVFADGLGGIPGSNPSALTLAVAAAGNSKGGVLNLYFAQ